MASVIAAFVIVTGITAGWVFVAQWMLPVRTSWRVVALALAFGAVSPLPLLLLFHLKDKLVLPPDPGLGDAFFISLTMAGLPEEFVKTVAVLAAFFVLRHFSVSHRQIDRATAFRLPVLCGLAFAAVENIGYSVNTAVTAMVNAEIGNPLIVPLVRSLAASFLHASLGCLMGIFFARMADASRFSWAAALAGFAAAVAGHTAVDWGLIVPVLTVLKRGQDLDPAEIETMVPHFLLAAVLIPTVIGAAVASVIVMRRRLRHARPA
ncbi:PrsW family glutamic-type intramembrane protease [Dongia sp.]|uniref:PrsW family glutamic-type intramembrane protease n=1 Tax=Dongia sp. TaxID=1977262 RepID=UPI0035B4D383